MGYKDKEKQKQVQRDWVRQKRIDKKGSTEQGSTSSSPSGETFSSSKPKTKGQFQQLEDGSLVGDGYVPTPKRGKDIKCITIGDQARSMKTMAMLASTVSQAEPDSYYAKHKAVKAQSYNPMMVGYVPPKE